MKFFLSVPDHPCPNPPRVLTAGCSVPTSTQVKSLAFILDASLSFASHIKNVPPRARHISISQYRKLLAPPSPMQIDRKSSGPIYLIRLLFARKATSGGRSDNYAIRGKYGARLVRMYDENTDSRKKRKIRPSTAKENERNETC